MHQPTTSHFQLAKPILRYHQGTLHLGVWLLATPSLLLYGFLDADWAGCPPTRRSSTEFCTYLGGNCISWSERKQLTVARSSTEAEYRAMANATAEITWLMFLLCDIGLYLAHVRTLFCDILFALHLTVNLVFHVRTKYVEIDYHFFRKKKLLSLVTRYIPSESQSADILTEAIL